MKNTLSKITVTNQSYGKLNGTFIYLTNDLYEELSKREIEGKSVSELLKYGRGLSGLKHLIEAIISNNKTLVFSLNENKIIGDKIFINFDEYRKFTQKQFFSVYRQTGLESSSGFLTAKFPDKFSIGQNQFTDKDKKQIQKDAGKILDSLAEKQKSQRYVIKKTTEIVKDLKVKKHRLKEDLKLLSEIQKQSNIKYYMEKLAELKERLKKDYPETKGKHSWQQWIFENNWLFGIHYQAPIQKEKVGFDNIPDFLFPTLDGFLDILEIKKPSLPIIQEDPSHTDSYIWSNEVNKALGQVINYIDSIELNRLQLKEKINEKYENAYKSTIFTIRPRAFILVGISNDWNDKMKQALRKLNYSLHGIQILTYSELVQRGQKIIDMYSEKS